MRSKQELKQLAVDMVAGRVFGTFHMRSDEVQLAGSVFMALGLSSQEEREDMERRGVVYIYEYMAKAGPRSVNGLPMFMSHHEILKDEVEPLRQYVDDLLQKQDEFLNEE